ncbi:MAG: hypothetical protein IPL32_20500 [Chloracidobacterium sp.]|nr:hypothetical protein [Chloracidobacterium sp.]
MTRRNWFGEIGGDWEDGGGGRCDEPIARGGATVVTTVLYGFNRVGQLVSATGRTVSEQNQNVRRRGVTQLDGLMGDTLSNGRLDNEGGVYRE